MSINDKLIDACMDGDLSAVKKCIKRGADIHAWYDEALRRTALWKHFEIVKFLIENGADIHALNDEALHCATEEGCLEIVKYLIEHGANIHALNDYALRYAAEEGHLQIVNTLRKAAGDKYKCHRCIIKSICLELCEDFRNEYR